MKGGQLWRRACVLVLFVTIPDIARSGPSGPQTPPNRQIQLVENAEKGALLFQNRCSMCHTTQLEGEVGQPQRGIADNDCQERDQDRRPDDPPREARLGANGIRASAISALIMAQTMTWLVMFWGSHADAVMNVPPSANAG